MNLKFTSTTDGYLDAIAISGVYEIEFRHAEWTAKHYADPEFLIETAYLQDAIKACNAHAERTGK